MSSSPSRRRRTTAAKGSRDMALSRQPDAGGRAPDRERQEEVDDVEGHDRQPDGPNERDTYAGRPAGGGGAEGGVRQDDNYREDEHLEERPDDVQRRQEQIEVVRIGAGRVVVGEDHDRVGREV